MRAREGIVILVIALNTVLRFQPNDPRAWTSALAILVIVALGGRRS